VDAVLQQNVSSTLIIPTSLLPATTITARLPFIEKRNRFCVLAFPILYDELQRFIICIDR